MVLPMRSNPMIILFNDDNFFCLIKVKFSTKEITGTSHILVFQFLGIIFLYGKFLCLRKKTLKKSKNH